MRFIGITGGVGAGKSAVLSYLEQKEGVRVMLADEIAHSLMEEGQACYRKILERFPGLDLLQADGQFDRGKLAQYIFSDEDKRRAVNAIVHPAVKEYVLLEWENEKKRGMLSCLFFEAALLIEEHYDEICDELWYIDTSEEIRKKRLKESRGYSDAKINGILKSQMAPEEYRSKCRICIRNNGSFEETCCQIEEALRRNSE